MDLKLGRQHLSVDVRVPDQEWSPEASREGGLRLLDAHLSARHLGRVAGDEVIHHLLRGQLRDRRQNSKGIAGQEDDLLRLIGHHSRDPSIGNVLQRVGHPGVLREARVIPVDLAGILVVNHILENGAKADRIIDLWFLVTREADALSIAATLDVEDAASVPDMLVVPDEISLGVCAESRLSSSAEPEEDGDVIVLADVGRGVQRKCSLGRRELPAWLQRHEVVHDREDTLLHLARILRAQDDHLLALEGH
mmetsp:Transcript_20325/g.44292  ORF Transcript_20325/g.44292 Transcript_20325/m.44292 type:complete len:251 (+) Transcript_20325:523-1275(+)